MKALVTGAAGFLGSHLVEALLARGDEVIALDHRLRGKCLSETALARVYAVESDIFDAAAVAHAAQGCAAIFHCAAVVGVEAYTNRPAHTMEVEEVGLRNVCAAALSQPNTRVMFCSSSAVYGPSAASVLAETDPVAPNSNYGIAKRYGELYLAGRYAEHGLQSTSLRIFNIYGPRQDERLVIPRFIRQALAGEPIVIYGDGEQTRDFVYVADVVDTALAAADRLQGCNIVNACSGRETSVKTLASKIIELTKSSSTLALKEQPSARTAFEVERCLGNPAQMQKLRDMHLPTSLEEGLAQTIADARRAASASPR
ncbi:MAG: NAD-dependent epimerase/dehydratase family protein [Xanthobacteraceae bacterium]